MLLLQEHRVASTVTKASTPCKAKQVEKNNKTLKAMLIMKMAEQENWPTKVELPANKVMSSGP